jgi:hypothetical protein
VTTTSRRIDHLPLSGIIRATRNPKAHQASAIRASIEKFGVTMAGLLDERTGRLVAGHGRLAALDSMRADGATPPEGVTEADGEWLVPIVRGWSSRSDAEAEAYLVADNRLSELGGWDDRLLVEVLDEIADDNPDLLELAGYSQTDLDDMIAALGEPPTLDDLEKEYGDPDDSDLWPLLRFKVPPHIRNFFMDLTERYGELDDSARFIRLVEWAHQEAA